MRVTDLHLSEFTDHQRNVFCVFSGQGVINLRGHLNKDPAFAHLREPSGQHRHPIIETQPVTPAGDRNDAAFDEPERDVIDDDDGLDDGSEMVIDTAPPAQHNGTSLDAGIIPPPPPPPAMFYNPSLAYQWNPQSQPWYPSQQHAHSAPATNGLAFPTQGSLAAYGPAHPHLSDAMDVTPTQPLASMAPSSGSGPSTARLTAAHPSQSEGFDQQRGSEQGDSSSSSPDAS